MSAVKANYILKRGERSRPVLWVDVARVGIVVPDAGDSTMERIMDAEKSRRFRSWGHDAAGVHWLATRAGLAMHQDPTYTRYTHQLIVRNDGWRIQGLDLDYELPLLRAGAMVCLDTWSPHAVVIDSRFGNPRPLFKVQAVVDRPAPLTKEEVWAMLSPRLLQHDLAAGIEKWKGRAPRGIGS